MRDLTPDKSQRLWEQACSRAGEDERLRNNHFFWALFHGENGYWNRKHLDRVEWIERYFTIKPKGTGIQAMALNDSQRKLERLTEEIERAGVPARILILKPRQTGISTFAQAMMFERVLRGENMRGIIVADTDDRAELLLRIAETARERMPKDKSAGTYWDFKMKSKASYSLMWAEPISGSIEITSAETKGAGRGGTKEFCHMSEVAWWKNPTETAAGILESIPDMRGTVVYGESTANGDAGWFRDEFWAGWNERDKPLDERDAPWVSFFIAWWEHDEYRWTRTFGAGRELPERVRSQIMASLDEEEEWLLKQSYTTADGETRRVDVDQLAWRRKKIAGYAEAGGITMLNQEHPSRPSVAFAASGARVFDVDIVARKLREARPAAWRGTLVDPSSGAEPEESYAEVEG